MTLEELRDQQRKIASVLFHDDALVAAHKEVCSCSQMEGGKPSCIQQEEDRPLTREEKKKDWVRRPFFAYDTARMCNSCAAYFFAERAAQTLHEMFCWDVRIKAEQERKAAETVNCGTHG